MEKEVPWISRAKTRGGNNKCKGPGVRSAMNGLSKKQEEGQSDTSKTKQEEPGMR